MLGNKEKFERNLQETPSQQRKAWIEVYDACWFGYIRKSTPWGKRSLNTVLQRHDTALSHSFGLVYMSLHSNLNIKISSSSLGLEVSSNFFPLRSDSELFLKRLLKNYSPLQESVFSFEISMRNTHI